MSKNLSVIYDEKRQYTDEFLEYMPLLRMNISVLVDEGFEYLSANDATPLDFQLMQHAITTELAYEISRRWLDELSNENGNTEPAG